MYLKDLGHSSFDSAETQLNQRSVATLQPAWTQNMGAKLGSGVTISGGVLYFGDWSGNFNAVDLLSGKILWQTPVGIAPTPPNPSCMKGIGPSSQGTVLGNTLYVGGGDAAVYALDTSTGKQIWRVPLADPALGNYIWSSIMPYQNRLYVGVASLGDCPIVRGSLARIDPQNPQQPFIAYWVPATDTGAGIWSTPAIDPATNEVFVTLANGITQDPSIGEWSGSFLNLDANTFAIKSYYLLPETDTITDLVGGSSPTLFTPPGGVPMLVASQKNGIIYAVRRSDMSLAWQTRLAVSCVNPVAGCGAISTASFDGTTLYAGAGVRDPNGFSLGSVWAIHPADGSTLWVRDTAGSVVAPTTVANGLVFVSTTKGLEIYDAATGQFLWSDHQRGSIFSQPAVLNGTIFSTYVKGDVVAWSLPAALPGTLTSYSSATGLPSVARGSIASLYGAKLTGNTITLEDSAGVQWPVDVLYASGTQINYVIPSGIAVGQATVSATTPTGFPLTSVMQASDVAPGIFSANSDGKGVAAAQAVLVNADGTLSYTPVFQCGAAAGSCVPTPIDLGTGANPVYLVLYGTGVRWNTSIDKVTCSIGGVAAPVSYAGPQYSFEGLDQINVQIPVSLMGRGQVDLTLSVDGQLSNTVTVKIK